MMKKKLKRAIAVGLAIAVAGVLMPINMQKTKPEVHAAASVKGTWTLINTESHQPEDYIKSDDKGNYYRIEFGEPKVLDNGDVQLSVSRYYSWTSPKGSYETLSTSVCSAPNSSYKSDEVAYLNESITAQFTGRGSDATCSARVDKSNTDEISFWATPYYGNFDDVNKSGKSWLTRTYDKDGDGTSTMKASYKFPWGHEGDTLSVYFYDHTGWLTSGEYEDLWPYFKWTYKFTPDSSESASPTPSASVKPSAAPTVKPTSAPTVTTAPTSNPGSRFPEDYTEFWTNLNPNAVDDGPSRPTKFTVSSSLKLDAISAYHYHNTGTPGTITLKKGSSVIGTWDAVMNANYYWVVFPNITLDAGTYTIECSDNSSWSYNSSSGNAGFATVYGTSSSSSTPVVTPVPTSDPGSGDTTDYRSTPEFKYKWTHNQDVYNISVTSGVKVKIKPLNKLAKSRSIKWIKNGKIAKIRWIRRCKSGKYKFRFSCAGTASWKPASVVHIVTVY